MKMVWRTYLSKRSLISEIVKPANAVLARIEVVKLNECKSKD